MTDEPDVYVDTWVRQWVSFKIRDEAGNWPDEWTEVESAVSVRRMDGGNEGDVLQFLDVKGHTLRTERLPADARMYLDGGPHFIDGRE